MDEISNAIACAIQKWKDEISGGESFDNGDEFVAILDNCAIHISLENGHLKTQFVPDVVRVDMKLSIYEGGDE